MDELANTAKSRQQSIEVYTGSTGVTLIATLPRDDKTQISDLVLNMGSIGLLREFLPRAIQGIAKSAQSLSQSLGKDRAIQAIVPMELYPDDSANTARKRTTSYRALDKNFVSVTYDATSTAPVEQVRVRGATFTYAVSTVDHRLLERA